MVNASVFRLQRSSTLPLATILTRMERNSGPGVGWYVGDDGASRYWDGRNWLSPTDGMSESSRDGQEGSQSPATVRRADRRSRSRMGTALIIATVLLALLGGGAAWMVINSQIQAQNSERAEAARAAEAKKAQDDKAKAAHRKRGCSGVGASLRG